MRVQVDDFAVEHGAFDGQFAWEEGRRDSKDLDAFPLREIRLQSPLEMCASARKPSYFSSNSQSGLEKGAARRLSRIGGTERGEHLGD